MVAFVADLRQRGAVSPEWACPRDELPRIAGARLRELLDSGLVRESASGALYVYERARPGDAPASTTARPAWMAFIFWVIAVLLPIVLFKLVS